ncbi:hypothetical protein PG994_005523 [Apiospora phragmitis]|uniref:Xylanolytic transcriptional activator regulatory domain-containing protein n=1 Tax=Apiospora phragmitis TaxID=2905665 RepID=A0ABR1VCJ0_9PEZI
METTLSPNPTTTLFGRGSSACSLRDLHPSLAQAAVLFAAFCENVAPVMRVVHLPTLTRQYWNAAASPDKLDRNTEALVFAVNYVSVGTMNDEQCATELGQTRQQAMARYRTAVEQALSRAHLLGIRSPMVLQAAVFYIEALKNEKTGQSAVRSLVVLVHHLARAMGLHRDGDAYGLRPFEAEMRRRLWWYVCILDHRTAEACGTEHAVRPHSFDARIPLHVNDGDLSPDMSALPPERDGIADMTFCLVRYETLRTVWCVKDNTSLAEKRAAISELERRLESRYLIHCDPVIPFQLKVVLSARMMVKRLWLVAHWPSLEMDNSRPTQRSAMTTVTTNGGATRDQLFAAAVDLLESAAEILASPTLSPWTWHAQTYSHWHAVAFRWPPSAECERAWRYACVVCEGWLAGGSTATNLGRPIQSLWDKVRQERENGKSNKGSDNAAGEPDREDSLDLFLDMFSLEPGDANDLCYTLMADQDMDEYFHFGEEDLSGTQVTDKSKS